VHLDPRIYLDYFNSTRATYISMAIIDAM